METLAELTDVEEAFFDCLVDAIVKKKPPEFLGPHEAIEMAEEYVTRSIILAGADISKIDVRKTPLMTPAQREEREKIVERLRPHLKMTLATQFTEMPVDILCQEIDEQLGSISKRINAHAVLFYDHELLYLNHHTRLAKTWRERLTMSGDANDARLLGKNLEKLVSQIAKQRLAGVVHSMWKNLETLSAVACYFEFVGEGLVELNQPSMALGKGR